MIPTVKPVPVQELLDVLSRVPKDCKIRLDIYSSTDPSDTVDFDIMREGENLTEIIGWIEWNELELEAKILDSRKGVLVDQLRTLVKP